MEDDPSVPLPIGVERNGTTPTVVFRESPWDLTERTNSFYGGDNNNNDSPAAARTPRIDTRNTITNTRTSCTSIVRWSLLLFIGTC